MTTERPAEPCFDNDSTRPPVDEKVLEELGFNLLNEYDWRVNEQSVQHH